MPTKLQHAPTKATPINYGARVQAPIPDNDTPLLSPEGIDNYISDDEDDGFNNTIRPAKRTHTIRRSKRVLQQLRANIKDGPHHIAALAANKKAEVPDLSIKNKKLAKRWASANLDLQMKEWAFKEYFAAAVVDKKTGKKLEYRDLIKSPELRERWSTSLANELGRLAQGVQDIPGTNTITFIKKSDIPSDRRKEVTYGCIVVGYKPDKIEKHRSRLTVGGDQIGCLIDASSPTANLPTTKMSWNSVLSTPGAKYFNMNISNFYLCMPMERPEFMQLPIKIIPQEIIEKYNLNDLVDDGWLYVRIDQTMYGLPAAGKLSNDLLVKRMSKAGYHPCQYTPGLWKHVWRPVTFTLVVDDFGIRFVGNKHANHLKKTLEKHYKITVDWKGSKYVGISLNWDYKTRVLHTSVPDFVKKALNKY